MICVHSQRLTGVVTSLVGILVIHVVRDANLCKHARMVAHILQTFLTDRFELFSQAIPDGSRTNFDGECRREVFPPQDSKYIDVVEAIPTMVRHELPVIKRT